MLKLIQRLLIIALAMFVLLFIYIGLAEACGKWVLEYSDIVGGRSGKMVNYCYYQDLTGSGQALSVQMPTYKECPVILDPCPEGGSDTTVTVNQPPASDNKFDKLYQELQELKKTNEAKSKQEWEGDYFDHLAGKISHEEFSSKWIGYGIYR